MIVPKQPFGNYMLKCGYSSSSNCFFIYRLDKDNAPTGNPVFTKPCSWTFYELVNNLSYTPINSLGSVSITAERASAIIDQLNVSYMNEYRTGRY